MISLLIVSSVLVLAQTPSIDWDKTLGGSSWEELHSLVPTPDGGVLVAGITQSPADGDVAYERLGDWDYWLIKLNIKGAIEWQQRYGGNKADRIWVSKQTRDGGFIIGGESLSDVSGNKTEPSRGNWDFWMIKVNKNGILEWDKTIGGDGHDAIRGDIIETQDGGFLLAGVSDSNVSGEKTEPCRGGWDYWIVRTDSRGNVLWDKTIGGEQRELMQAAIEMPDGGFLLGGESRSGVSGDKNDFLRGLNDYWVVRVDAKGNLIWEKTIGANWDEAIFDMVRAETGVIYLAGFSGSDATFEKSKDSYGSIDYWIVAIDDDGNLLWEKNYGGKNPDTAYDIKINERGNLVVGGISSSDTSAVKKAPAKGVIDYWLLYLTPDGEVIWDETYGSFLRDALTETVIGADGSIFMAGHSESNTGIDKTEPSRGVNDIWVVKTGCNIVPQMPDSLVLACNQKELTLAAQFEGCRDCRFQWQAQNAGNIKNIILPIRDTTFNVKAIDANGCIALDTISLYNNPLKAIELDLTQQNCTDNIQINNVFGGTPPYQHTFFEQKRHSESPNGKKEYEVFITDSVGCSLDTIVYLDVPEEWIFDLGDDILANLGDEIKIEFSSNRNIQSITWRNIDTTECNSCTSLKTIAIDPATVFVEVLDENGCTAKDNINIRIRKDYDVFCPNAFSPDGDGQNDAFTIYVGKDVKTIHTLQVFDRWGQSVFKKNNLPLNDPNEGWKGAIKNVPASTGIYIYYADVEFVDGHRKIFKGDVLLTR